ncbi:MAG TPA: hypothetical protein PLM61_07030 [Thermoanaerobaculales bacterium]|nr:hypothetical protein [Thermoanaerobaculales bacterium]
MRPQDSLFQSFVLTWTAAIALLLGAGAASGQALHSERFANGSELVFVTQPLAGATTLAWPEADGVAHAVTLGQLNLVADAQRELAAADPPPPVVVVVGGTQFAELRSAVERALAGRAAAGLPVERPPLEEGGIDRRLGALDGDATVRIELPLPGPADGRRSSVEVLWELLPELLSAQHPGFRTRVDGDLGLLEGGVEADLVDLELRRLRFEIARIGESALIDGGRVEAARSRLEVRRRALLAAHPDAAVAVLERWQGGGAAGVRELLFGISGVTEATVRDAARAWLAQHPGRVVLTLPPRVFNPRFAPGPEVVTLDNDAVAAILEREVAGLAVVSLRPIVLPDIDGAISATVLARVAAELRAMEGAPGWVRVRTGPAALELATFPDGLPELIEVLQDALDRVAADDLPLALEDGSARRRALELMSGVLSLDEGGGLTPASLLRPGNLAIGVIAPDAETAAEAIEKFGLGGPARSTAPIGQPVQPVPRTREAAPGDDSALAVAVDLAAAIDDLSMAMVGEVLARRVAARGIARDVEVLRPLVPGRRMLVLVIQAPGPLAELERRLEKAWTGLSSAVGEDEAAGAGRALAARLAADASGPLGQARRCAALAAGDGPWRSTEDLELAVLTLSSEQLSAALGQLPKWQGLTTTGAGQLPVPGAPRR